MDNLFGKILRTSTVLFGLSFSLFAQMNNVIWLEAESFDELGGWKIDQQFMDQMGSPFLLAHGIGKKVNDAKTSVVIYKNAKWTVWVRTRNWTAPWSAKEAAGKFKVFIDGMPVGGVQGEGSGDWSWRKAGEIELQEGMHEVALRDLTGFDGRCDAVVLSCNETFVPSDDPAVLADMRRSCVPALQMELVDADLVVVGGGVAGICAAVTAARSGLKVALVHDRPILGGNNSSEVRVHLGGRINIGEYPRLGDVVAEIGPAKPGNAESAVNYEDLRKADVVAAEKNISIFLNTHVNRTEKQKGKLLSVYGVNIATGQLVRFKGRFFADCTGDGSVAALAGAEFMYGRESKKDTGESRAVEKADSQVMGTSIQWNGSKRQEPQPFPDLKWALPFTDKTVYSVARAGKIKGDWNWETGMTLNQITEFERIRDYGMLVAYSNWSYLKNHSNKKKAFENYSLDWVAYIGGKRESRRIVGDYILKEQDLVNRVEHPDGTACTSWSVDLHYPDAKNAKNFPTGPFLSVAKHTVIHFYPVPYRCLYSKDIGNLFMAGRNISVSHVALGTTRVMRTTGMLGEVVGMAAAVCAKRNCLPRDVYTSYFEDLKIAMKKGAGLGTQQPPQKYNSGSSLSVKPEKRK